MDAQSSTVARATAYLFKVPEGADTGVDPGFFRQMQDLENALQDVTDGPSQSDKSEVIAMVDMGMAAGIITAEQAASLLTL